MQGNLLVLNVIGFQGMLNYKITEDGAGLKSTEVEPILSSTDANFRPVDAEVGPDGALYFIDWHNPIIGHMQHNLRDPTRDRSTAASTASPTRAGRCSSRRRSPAQPIPQLLDLLKEPEDRVRYRAKIELSGRDTQRGRSPRSRHGWTGSIAKDPGYEHQHDGSAVGAPVAQRRQRSAARRGCCESSDPWARAAATRVLCYWRDRVPNPLALLEALANDAHPAVRLEAVRAASFFQDAEAAKVALESLNHPQDRFLKYTLDQTMNTLKKFMN